MASLRITVRSATASDSPALAELFLETRRKTFTWQDVSSFRLTDFAAETVGEKVIVAVSQRGELLGFAAVWEPDSFLHHLYVHPNWQGQGVGSRLLQYVCEKFHLPMRLKCLLKNGAALAFYRSRGWIPVAQKTGIDGGYALLEYAA